MYWSVFPKILALPFGSNDELGTSSKFVYVGGFSVSVGALSLS
jgi:hypothetical protein